MGFEKERFTAPPPKELLCPVCKCVLEEPIQGVCGHVYCSECRIQSDPWNYEDVCPVGRTGHVSGRQLVRGHGRVINHAIIGQVSVDGNFMDALLPGQRLQSENDGVNGCPSGAVKLALPLKGVLDNLRIKCKYFDTCSWLGRIGDIKSHESVCTEQVIRSQIEEKLQEIRDLKKKLLDLQTSDK